MVGIDILNTEEILKTPEWIENVLNISIIALCVCLFLAIFSAINKENRILIFSEIMVVISGIFIIVFAILYSANEKPTGRYRYEATIDESVSITEVYKNYNVVEQRGDIWVLEDKENKEERK